MITRHIIELAKVPAFSENFMYTKTYAKHLLIHSHNSWNLPRKGASLGLV